MFRRKSSTLPTANATRHEPVAMTSTRPVAKAPVANKAETQAVQMFATYALFIMGAGSVVHLVGEGRFSSISTLSVLLQCLALALLALQIISTGSAAGISARTLQLDALALGCKLSSTLWLDGYLPADDSGDFCYQLIDLLSFCILTWLIRQVLVVKRHTYEHEQDVFPMLPFIIAAFVSAILFHGNMDSIPFFDIMWTAGLNLGTIAVMPQMWLITRTGGRIQTLMSHSIAAMGVGRALECIFIWYVGYHVTCHPYIEGYNHAIWAILTSHALHMVLLCDFAYYYLKAVLAHGLNCKLELENFSYNV